MQPSLKGWPRHSSSAASSSAHDQVALVLGDNIFYGHGFQAMLARAAAHAATAPPVFAYPVKDPERYGVVELDADGHVRCRWRKNQHVRASHLAVTGLYFYDNQVVDIASDSAPRRAASWKSRMSIGSTWCRQSLQVNASAADLPGSIPDARIAEPGREFHRNASSSARA